MAQKQCQKSQLRITKNWYALLPCHKGISVSGKLDGGLAGRTGTVKSGKYSGESTTVWQCSYIYGDANKVTQRIVYQI